MRSPQESKKASQQARLDLVFAHNPVNESFTQQHQFVIQDPDQLNQRYNQFKVRFAETLLPSRELFERQMGKLLQKEFPQLYRFKLLLHITQASEMLFIIETEFTYWFAALRAYFLHLDNNFEHRPSGQPGGGHSGKKAGSKGATGSTSSRDSFLKDWSDQDFLDTLVLAGMFIKKKLLQAQIVQFDVEKQFHNNQMYLCTQNRTSEKMQRSRKVQDKHHSVIVEDSQNEIDSIEQNIVTFKHVEDYFIKYKYFEQLMIGPHIKFAIENITLVQINKLYSLLNGKATSNPEVNPKTTQKDRNQRKSCDKPADKTGGSGKSEGVLGKRTFQEDLLEDDCQFDDECIKQKAQKRDPVMVSYIEWQPQSDSTRESSNNNSGQVGDSSHCSYSIPNCHEIDYNWKVDAILKSAQQYNKDDKKN